MTVVIASRSLISLLFYNNNNRYDEKLMTYLYWRSFCFHYFSLQALRTSSRSKVKIEELEEMEEMRENALKHLVMAEDSLKQYFNPEHYKVRWCEASFLCVRLHVRLLLHVECKNDGS